MCVQNLLSHALSFALFLSLSILLKIFVCMPCHSMPSFVSKGKEEKKNQHGYSSSSSPIPNSSRRTTICKPSTTSTTTPHTQR